MNELDFNNINAELNQIAKRGRYLRRVNLYVLSSTIGTILGLVIIWLLTRTM